MQFSKWKIGAVVLVCMLLPGSVHAQIVKNERLLSFEEKQVLAFVTTAAGSQLGISDEHYRDGDHSLSWTFEPGAALSKVYARRVSRLNSYTPEVDKSTP